MHLKCWESKGIDVHKSVKILWVFSIVCMDVCFSAGKYLEMQHSSPGML